MGSCENKSFTMPLENISAAERSELLTCYACLILADDKAPINDENINKLIAAAGMEGKVEPYWPKIFANLLDGKDVGEMLMTTGGGAAPASGGDGGDSAGGDAKKEEKKKEESSEEESEADMGFGLFN